MMSNSPFSAMFNVATRHIASKLFPKGFDVSSNAPDTFEKLIDHVQKTGRMLVWNGSSENTIYDCEETNFCFRAWHDWHHVNGNFPFTPYGEAKACQAQQKDVVSLYGNGEVSKKICSLLEAEVIGQFEYLMYHGDFPENQRAFVLHYLENSLEAIQTKY